MMTIKTKPSEYIKILNDEIEEIEKFTGKSRLEISATDYYKYLLGKHPEMKEYQSREYCEHLKCNSYNNREKYGEIICSACEIYRYNQWLQKSGYKIVKE